MHLGLHIHTSTPQPARPGGWWRRLLHGEARVWDRPDWVQLVGADWPARILDVTVTDCFHAKQGRSTGRWLLRADGRQLSVYLKRHYRLPRWRGLLAALGIGPGWSPALHEWQSLQWALDHGLPVPAPVAVGELLRPWGRLQSVLAIEELVGMLPLHQAVPLACDRLAPVIFRQWKRGLIAEMVRLVRLLHGLRRFHRDLYLCHFYIREEDTGHLPSWSGRVHLIDLHRLCHRPLGWRLWQGKDLGQLLYSSDVRGVDARDRLTFWRLYLGGERRRLATAWLRRLILFKWRTYCRSGEKRRRRKEQQRRAA
jgi:heptose I phosphotransferase